MEKLQFLWKFCIFFFFNFLEIFSIFLLILNILAFFTKYGEFFGFWQIWRILLVHYLHPNLQNLMTYFMNYLVLVYIADWNMTTLVSVKSAYSVIQIHPNCRVVCQNQWNIYCT